MSLDPWVRIRGSDFEIWVGYGSDPTQPNPRFLWVGSDPTQPNPRFLWVGSDPRPPLLWFHQTFPKLSQVLPDRRGPLLGHRVCCERDVRADGVRGDGKRGKGLGAHGDGPENVRAKEIVVNNIQRDI